MIRFEQWRRPGGGPQDVRSRKAGSPQPAQWMPEGAKLTQIAGNSMVLVVPLNNLPEPFTQMR
jgi:hypothetical protein